MRRLDGGRKMARRCAQASRERPQAGSIWGLRSRSRTKSRARLLQGGNAMRLKTLATMALLGSATWLAGSSIAVAETQEPTEATETTLLPTGQRISPTAAQGATYSILNPGLADNPTLPAGFAQSEALSPDGRTLLVLTSGYNYVGIAFSPDGRKFYVPGAGEDNVHVFALNAGAWTESGAPIKLGHTSGLGIGQGATATGIAVTADGARAVVANRYNDSVSVVDLVNSKVLAEQDLRPGKSGGTRGTPGGEYPNSVAIVGNRTAYVSSERDREVVVVDIAGATPGVKARISVQGNPNKMVLNRTQTTLYVASDNADIVSIIDTQKNIVTDTVATVAPAGLLTPGKARYKGASPDALALSQDERTLYVANRGTNSLAVVSLVKSRARVTGLIPTGWYPSDVRVSADGETLYVSNAKTVPGPNPGNCLGYETFPCLVANSPVTFGANQYVENLTGSALLSLPVPNHGQLLQLTRKVVENNGFDSQISPEDEIGRASCRDNIKHVIYIIKENRTYDQVLGDLGKGNSDPALAEFPQKTTPNLHALANEFVALDNFYDTGEVSGNGWPWSTAARESDAGAKMLPPNYAGNGGGGSYDWEGTNRNVNVGLSGSARDAANPLSQSLDADTLPGTGNVASPDGPDGDTQQGYLWNAALRANLSVR